MDKIKVRLVRSLIGCTPQQRKTVAALGLRKIRQENELPKNDCTLGMVKHVQHLVEVVE
ncbi:50S ribosomal protein L30 [Desulfobaculum bizertense]|uniref:50S ribosomal protein L30 n=1 Tax=Desulfobaculum bizertense DSM 18034 TaxID=1121442 RepID=A0A1T4WG58_9BACT|nr:50S ribosomal protein L30 [Desulfobaculum bizertense]UIJ36654.1 50S ribosomal protein L30 [Desulfobaculum bizertense]SKA76149.1 large subunit ribosomal protein L30 [Desulfobaculum bizertense DSM 18034]